MGGMSHVKSPLEGKQSAETCWEPSKSQMEGSEDASTDQEELDYTVTEMIWNVGLLSVCFGMGWAMLFIQVGTTTVAAKQWASTAFGAVPYGILAGFHALFALPAQMLMRRFGARPSYVFGGVMGSIGNAVCVLAARYQSPALLCIGSPFCGIANAYANFLRFESARFVSAKHLPTAVSAVVAGGVIGGGMGPVISRFSKDILSHEFEGTYLISVCIWIVEFCLVAFIQFRSPKADRLGGSHGGTKRRDKSTIAYPGKEASTSVSPIPSVPQKESQETAGALEASEEGAVEAEGTRIRSFSELLRQPAYVVALISGTLAYTSMATVMLAALLAMKAVQPGSGDVDVHASSGIYTFDDTSNAILIHVEAMFVPSFFSGLVIGHLGPALANLGGFVFLLAGIFLFMAGTQLWVFFVSLTLVGLGWNFSFVGSTTLVSSCHTPAEKDKVQGFNDLCIFGVNTVVTVTSSLVLQTLNNWNAFILIYGFLTVPGLVVAALYWWWHR